jgi:hypothetical protein
MTRKSWSLAGAGAGLVLFLALGLLPALLYGGYAGVALASALAGGPVGAGVAVRGVVLVGALFALAGAAAGAALAVLTGVPAEPPAKVARRDA